MSLSIAYIIGVTNNPEVPGRAQRTGFLIATVLSCLAALTVSVWQSDRLYNHRYVY